MSMIERNWSLPASHYTGCWSKDLLVNIWDLSFYPNPLWIYYFRGITQTVVLWMWCSDPFDSWSPILPDQRPFWR